mmetsp:Transcript_22474/g.21600  ORF Transcript_22474/g.21600 Transcript_22474/m.21600 type:complete len:640 (-) Transcript_22474:185-2104(-)|eukprot:CAMPEP_0197834638 /NCGR_PEP_ID=MMETSP1437-20131217/23171_1 /TAXON_ID=49252 ORGANISM="Eucampia antarctica, Strain CCMP1452" /NCGR_SAMPLE_ID=MMETSP1437 /ASSEMBLY_ACC=CAM_ASM_001096 /LENGTH=639 /DNA_ID=CAMNT_0043439495 /DNA_START=102 /DNA_END=2021 /DNA_ORIENTATION=-
MVNLHRKDLFVLLAVLGILLVSGGWIDPDTPKSKHITRPRSVPDRFRPKAKENATEVNETSTKETSINETAVPSDSTSSQSPSSSPTQQPTIDTEYELVMSDEFNTAGRTFEDGADPKWTAMNKNDYTNAALHFYSEKNVKVNDEGNLVLTSTNEDTSILGYNDASGEKEKVTKHFKSAMMQTWNKFCFTGGIIEAEVKLPGKNDVGGLWPAFWLLGNMARHTYVQGSTHVWPWSSNTCTETSKVAQKFNACNKYNHYGLHNFHGRGAPEIDIFEVQAGPTPRYHGAFMESNVGQPFMSSSFQVAPGRQKNRPSGGRWPGPGQWYDGLTGGDETNINILFYGDYNHFVGDPPAEDPGTSARDYWSDAISYNKQLHETHFEKTHKYRLEWELPDNSTGFEGYLRWYLDDEFIFEVDGKGLADSGEGAEISTEPSYIILNTAISETWGFPYKCPDNCPCEKYDCKSNFYQKTCGFSPGFCEMMVNDPVEYKVNWVRVYQNKKDPKQLVGCSTPERPTSQFIKGHPELFKEEKDVQPLKAIKRGGGTCKLGATGVSSEACGGGEKGICTTDGCLCNKGFTGPTCVAPDGFNDIDYEPEESLGFIAPRFDHSRVLWIGLGTLIMSVVVSMFMRNKLDGYQPIQ